MDRHEKLTEAKLMAIEKIVDEAMNTAHNTNFGHVCPYAYDYAKLILEAIHNAEIAEGERQHEANLLTRDEKPDADNA